jgi:electron transfer flavoprotein beta subunit
MRARRKDVVRTSPEWHAAGPEKIRLRVPVEAGNTVEVLGNGPAAAPQVVEMLRRIGVLEA